MSVQLLGHWKLHRAPSPWKCPSLFAMWAALLPPAMCTSPFLLLPPPQPGALHGQPRLFLALSWQSPAPSLAGHAACTGLPLSWWGTTLAPSLATCAACTTLHLLPVRYDMHGDQLLPLPHAQHAKPGPILCCVSSMGNPGLSHCAIQPLWAGQEAEARRGRGALRTWLPSQQEQWGEWHLGSTSWATC